MPAQCASQGRGCVMLCGSRPCHWWGVRVYVLRYPLFSGSGSSNKLIKLYQREVGCVGLYGTAGHPICYQNNSESTIVAPPSDDFQICSTYWKRFSFPKNAETSSKSAYNADAISCWSNLNNLPKPSSAISVTKKQSEKHHTSSCHTDVRRSISTKFCTMIEDLRAIILST